MQLSICNIVVIRGGVVHSNDAIICVPVNKIDQKFGSILSHYVVIDGADTNLSADDAIAEKFFLRLQANCPHFPGHLIDWRDQMDDFITEGFYEVEGMSVCISWANME